MDNRELVKQLRAVLANTFVLYYKTHAFHWNVEGHDFSQLHRFFKKMYEEIFDSVDLIAENIRYLTGYAPNDLETLVTVSTIKTNQDKRTADQMIAELHADNVAIQSVILAAFEVAQSMNDQGVMNMLADRLAAHKKHAWMLRATSK